MYSEVTTLHVKTEGPRRQWPATVFVRLFSLLLACLLLAGSVILGLPGSAHADTLTITAALPAGQVNSYYSAALTASGGTPPYTWSMVGGALPAWLNLTATGVISGTTGTQGTFSFVVKATDSAANSAQKTLSLSIAAPPLIFGLTSLPTAKENSSYSATMNVSGGTLPYTFWVVGGALPEGLTLDTTTGTISGIPARGSTGTSSFTIRLTDSSAIPVSTQRSFAITVERGSYQALISIGTGLKEGQTDVSINGIQVASLQGGQSIQRSFDLDTSQTVSVESIIQDPSDSGIRFKAASASITVTEFSPSAQFNYYTEYYVEVKNQPVSLGQIGGSGWYREGNMLLATAPATLQLAAEPDTQYRFAYWMLPTGAQVSGGNLNQNINISGVYTASYDTYYRLSFNSPWGEQKESAWFKAGTRTDWQLSVAQVPMSGILGFFQGTLNAVNNRGSVIMDRPQNITVKWEPDYTMPLILIPAALLLAILCIYGLYVILRGPANKPVPVYPGSQALPPTQPFIPQYPPTPATVYFVPPPVYPVPPPVYPVPAPVRPSLAPAYNLALRPEPVTIGITDVEKQDSHREARQKIIEEFGRLLDQYAHEITSSRQNPKPPQLNSTKEVKRPALPEQHKLN